MNSLKIGNQGQIGSIIAVIVVLFTLGIIFFFTRLVYDGVIDGYESTGMFNDTYSQKAIAGFDRSVNFFDYIIVISMVLLLVGVGFTTYKLASRPIFAIVMFLFAPFLGFISYLFNYLFINIVGNTVFDTVRVSYPLTMIVCTNLHWIGLCALCIGIITLFGKKDEGQYAQDEQK